MRWFVSTPGCIRDGETGQLVAICVKVEFAGLIVALPKMIEALRASRTYVRANLHALGEYAGSADVNTLDVIEQALSEAGLSLETSREKSNG